MLRGRKRYWTSKGLDKPRTLINGLDLYGLWDLVKQQKPTYITDSYELHNVTYHLELADYAQQTAMHFPAQGLTPEIPQTTYRSDSVKRSVMSMESS